MRSTLPLQYPSVGPKLFRFVLRTALFLPLLLSSGAGTADECTKTASRAYAGLALRDLDDQRTVVSWIRPGPLDGRGLRSPTLARPDLIVSVNGEWMNSETFDQFIQEAAPGQEVVIEYRRADPRGPGLREPMKHEDEILQITFALSDHETWTGTVGRARPDRLITALDLNQARLAPFDAGTRLGAAMADNELLEPAQKLMDVFEDWLDRHDDYHLLHRVETALLRPFDLYELQQAICEPLSDVADDPFGVAISMISANLDLQPPAETERSLPIQSVEEAVKALSHRIREADTLARQALGEMWQDEAWAEQCVALLRVPRDSFYVAGPDSARHLEVIRRSMEVDFQILLEAFSLLGVSLEFEEGWMEDSRAMETPAALSDAVEGPILAAAELEGIGWVVVGASEENAYDLTRVVGVINPEGDSRFHGDGYRLGVRWVINLDGESHHTGSPEQGPASALLGVSVVDERGGDTIYEGEMLSAGAALFGMSLLLDRGGNDVYRGTDWSMGAAMYGAGLLFDLGSGSDLYLGEFLCQGVGGARGLGLLVDTGGNDLFRANGPQPSGYQTPAVFNAFSQGIGFGLRGYTAGGIGILANLAGNDRYEVGEFGQGGGYFLGLGILYDAAGDDFYYGTRYAQGFGVHQGVGILVDAAGDDTYWAQSVAAQGAGWDLGTGLLWDGGGNDTFRARGLAQGSAAQQAFGFLISEGGDNHFHSQTQRAQGQSGNDDYHWEATGATSFSLFWNGGDGHSYLSTERPPDGVLATGSPNPDNPAASSLHGLYLGGGKPGQSEERGN